MTREIIFFQNYFIDFYLDLDLTVQEKIEYVFTIIRTVDLVPERFIKHIEGTDGLYEIRIKTGSAIYRIFCCFDSGSLVVYLMDSKKRGIRLPKKRLNEHCD